MSDRSLPAFALALSLAMLVAAPARANDGEFNGTGASVYPVRSVAVALDEEDLTIRQTGPAVGTYVAGWDVRVVYAFRNTTDAAVTVQMGFPEQCHRGPEDIDTPDDVCGEPTIRDFTAAVDGKTVQTTVKAPKGGATDVLKDVVFQRVHTFSVPFGPKQTRRVVHTYRLQPSLVSPYTSIMQYILQTGGLWVGPIRRLDVTLAVWDRFEDVRVVGEGTPKPAASEEDGWTLRKWHHEDVEPTWDLEVHFSHPVGLERSEAISAACALDAADLAKIGREELRVLRNVVYAAYGYAFSKADLREHFAKQPWYRPHPDYTNLWLDKADVACVQRIEGAEKKAAAR